MIYLAIPYTDANEAVMEARAEIADRIAAYFMNDCGIYVYSPISSWHHIAKKYNLPKDFTYWKRFNFHMLSLCDTLVVIRAEGWEESEGLQAEISYAKGLGITVGHVKAYGVPTIYRNS